MSTPDPVPPAAAPDTGAPAPRKRGRKRLLLALPVFAAALGGGGYYAWSHGLVGRAHAKTVVAPGPKLNVDPESDPAHPRYKTSYYKIEGAFTTNLQDSPRFVQVEIGVATIYDPLVLARVQTHEIPIRSAVLAVLAQQSEAGVTSPAGRAALQAQLRTAIDRVLVQKEGFGGISDVYVTGLVIQ